MINDTYLVLSAVTLSLTMNSPNNNSNRNNDSTKNLDRRKEEANIFNSFAAIIQDAFVGTGTDGQSHVDRLDRLYQQPEYSAEKAHLTKMNNNGMVAGIAAGVGSFIFLRRGPRLLSRYLVRRAEARGGGSSGTANNNYNAGGGGPGGYQFDRRNPFENAKQMSQPTNAMGEGASSQQLPPPPPPSSPRQPGIIVRTIKFGLDVFVSGMMALYMSAVWTDKKKLLNEAAEIPLVEGRSLISDELCGNFMKHYATIPQDTWRKHRGTSDALTAIESFVVNCQRRQMLEQSLRHERGLQPGGSAQDYHPTIPSPGVPTLDVVLADIGRDSGDGNEASNDDPAFQEDSFQGDSFDSNFSEGETKDQWQSSNFDGNEEKVDKSSVNEGGRRWGW